MSARSTAAGSPIVRLGLRENWPQFALLIATNAFVGGMVGLERTVVPLLGASEFRIASTTVIVSFIVTFGVVKAISNLVSGHLADAYGRKHMLVFGWLVGLPVPFMLAWGPSWGWVVAANALLGDRKSTRLNSSHSQISYAVFCLKKKKKKNKLEELCE